MTPYGKAVRRLRIERWILIGAMANMLGVSSNFLRRIERGERPIPDGFVDRVADVLGLDIIATNKLEEQAGLSMSRAQPLLAALPTCQTSVPELLPPQQVNQNG